MNLQYLRGKINKLDNYVFCLTGQIQVNVIKSWSKNARWPCFVFFIYFKSHNGQKYAAFKKMQCKIHVRNINRKVDYSGCSFCHLVSIYRIWQSFIANDLLTTHDANTHFIPRATHFCWGFFFSHVCVCSFGRVALRAVVVHEDIHTPVCFLVAASQDRPGLG